MYETIKQYLAKPVYALRNMIRKDIIRKEDNVSGLEVRAMNFSESGTDVVTSIDGKPAFNTHISFMPDWMMNRK